MCGLFGAFGTSLNRMERENAVTLGILSQFRGIHSTGMAIVRKTSYNSKKTKATIFKETTDSTDFFSSPRPQELLFGTTGNAISEPVQAIIGHCRAATHGAVNITNAHPYLIDGYIIGTHNGTIPRFAPVKSQEDVRTDSMELFERISRTSVKDALADAGNGSAFALVWFDKIINRLYMIRNELRPLFLMRGNGDVMYYASEPRMLKFMAEGSQSGIDSRTVDIFCLKPHVLHSWDIFSPRNIAKEPIDYRELREERFQRAQEKLKAAKEKAKETRDSRSFFGGYEETVEDIEPRPPLARGLPTTSKESKKVESPKQETTKETSTTESQGGTGVAGDKFPKEYPDFLKRPAGGPKVDVKYTHLKVTPKIYVEPREPKSEDKAPAVHVASGSAFVSTGTIIPLPDETKKDRHYSPTGCSRVGGKAKYYHPTLQDPSAGIPQRITRLERNYAYPVPFINAASATPIVPSFVDHVKNGHRLPRVISNGATCKRLYYRGPNKLYIPAENIFLMKTLQKGCVISGKIPELHNLVYWISDNEFVMREHANDPYLQAYYKDNSLFKGGPVSLLCYLTDSQAIIHNNAIALAAAA